MQSKDRVCSPMYTVHRINPRSRSPKNECLGLYSKGKYKTKLTPEDIPEWFLFGHIYNSIGFLSAKGVMHMLYVPDYTTHKYLFDSDYLFISYDQPIAPFIKENGDRWYTGYDYYLSRQEILLFIDAADKFSHINTEDIRAEIRKKVVWFANQKLLNHAGAL